MDFRVSCEDLLKFNDLFNSFASSLKYRMYCTTLSESSKVFVQAELKRIQNCIESVNSILEDETKAIS